MKKIILMLILAFTIAPFSAQNYGIRTYVRTDGFMSSAQRCGLNGNDGYVILNSVPTLTSVTNNFFISRVDANGDITTNPYIFENGYQVYFDNNCGAGAGQVDSVYGANIIETVLTSPARDYALAGTTEEGVFFATLDATGSVVDQAAYTFPNTPNNSSGITKPYIVESLSTPGTYYIVGSFNNSGIGYIYILMVDNTGTLLNAVTYFPAFPAFLVPLDIIMSPYQNELIVVGRADEDPTGPPGFHTRAFFLRIDDSNLNWIECSFHGAYMNSFPSLVPNESFNCITLSTTQAAGPPGFIVAGVSDSITDYTLWTKKFSPTGVELWNRVVDPLMTTIQE